MNILRGIGPVSLIVFLVLVMGLTLSVLVLTDHVETGFTGKTVWNWLEVVGVPVTVVIIAGGFALVAQRAGQLAEQDSMRDIERSRDATLRDYLDRMSDLILNHHLQKSLEDSPVRAVALARTFGALRGLNGPRKGILLQFLNESRLISVGNPVVSLTLADLSSTNLSRANLEGADLSGANLRDADFYDANLRGANLEFSVVDDEQLSIAKDLVGATMPDGNKMSEEQWNQLKAPKI